MEGGCVSSNMGNMTKSGSSRTWEDTTKQISPGLNLPNACPVCGECRSSKAHRAKAAKCSAETARRFAEQNTGVAA